MQLKRDVVWTTVGWSVIGNIFGLGAVSYLERNSDKFRNLKHFRKREGMKVGAFLLTVSLFTMYGYGNAN